MLLFVYTDIHSYIDRDTSIYTYAHICININTDTYNYETRTGMQT